MLTFARQLRVEVTPQNWWAIKGKVGMAVFMLVLATLWFGCSNAVREIVGEWAI